MGNEIEIPDKPLQREKRDIRLKWENPIPSEIPWENLTPENSNKKAEEILANTYCGKTLLLEVEKGFGKSFSQAKKYIKALPKNPPEDQENKSQWENKIFATTQLCLHLPSDPEKKENSPKNLLLNYMGRRQLLKKMRPEQGLSLAISAIQKRDVTTFKKIIFNFKTIDKRLPTGRTELLDFTLSDGKTLGHLAAEIDLQEAIQYIAYNHRDLLEKRDTQGDTLIHTASRFQAAETLQYLLDFSKRLFGAKNNRGETPLDLESGPSICKAVTVAIVEQDIKAGEETLRKALDICKIIQKKPVITGVIPTPTMQSPKLEMEKIPLEH